MAHTYVTLVHINSSVVDDLEEFQKVLTSPRDLPSWVGCQLGTWKSGESFIETVLCPIRI